MPLHSFCTMKRSPLGADAGGTVQLRLCKVAILIPCVPLNFCSHAESTPAVPQASGQLEEALQAAEQGPSYQPVVPGEELLQQRVGADGGQRQGEGSGRTGGGQPSSASSDEDDWIAMPRDGMAGNAFRGVESQPAMEH